MGITSLGDRRGWSSELALWKKLRNVSEGLRWHRIPHAVTYSQRVPDHATGVYLICGLAPVPRFESRTTCTVFYAGSVMSRLHGLRSRFGEHLKKPTPILRRFVKCYFPDIEFWFCEIERQDSIREMESLLIETFNPPCNLIKSPGTDVILATLGTPTPFSRTAAP